MKPQLSAMLFFLAGQGVMVSDGRGRGLEGCGLKTDAGNHFRILLGDGFDSMRYLKRCRPCLLEGTRKKHFVIFFIPARRPVFLPGRTFLLLSEIQITTRVVISIVIRGPQVDIFSTRVTPLS